MKNIMAWVKSNLTIVILSAVILLILPAAFVGSSMWNSKIRKSREKAVTQVNSQLDAAKVTYSIPPAVPGGKSIEFPWPAPNEAATAYFRTHRQKIEDQVKRITVEAEAINKAGHAPLLDGVFPTPANSTRTLEFIELLVGTAGKPSVYQKLLDEVKAGPAADPVRVAEVLREADRQAIDRLKAERNTDKMTEEEAKAHLEHMVKLRIGQYKSHAQSISVYATTDCLPPDVPRSIPPQPPPVEECWLWQEDYWAIRDLFLAVKEANTINGRLAGVEQSVVKRVEKIALMNRDAHVDSVSGRKGGPSNTVYDVRTAVMTVIVSSSRLPEFINAVSRTNFMSVVDVDVTEVDTTADLGRGFYYGEEHVVKAEVTIESIWLKSWITANMPDAEKKRRESAGAEDTSMAAAPAAPPPRARGGADDEGGRPRAPAKSGRSTKRPGPK